MSGFTQTVPDMPDDVVLRVSGVSKKFCRNLHRSMWYVLSKGARECVLEWGDPVKECFTGWAVQGVIEG